MLQFKSGSSEGKRLAKVFSPSIWIVVVSLAVSSWGTWTDAGTYLNTQLISGTNHERIIVGAVGATPSYMAEFRVRSTGLRWQALRLASQDSLTFNSHVTISGVPTGTGNNFVLNSFGTTSGIVFSTGNPATGNGLGTEWMRITSAGSVGIGTTSPAAKLHVEGGDFRLNSSAGGSANIDLTYPSGAQTKLQASLTRGVVGTFTNHQFEILTNNATRMAVTNAGNIGIGTTTPANKLDVIGNASISGNVGIGTTTPANKLDVVGNASFSGDVQANSLIATVIYALPDGTLLLQGADTTWAHKNYQERLLWMTTVEQASLAVDPTTANPDPPSTLALAGNGTFSAKSIMGNGIYPVASFGAKGDGTTDDAAAFQAALNYAGDLSKGKGGTVQVPAGKYMIKTPLYVPTGVTLQGSWGGPHGDDSISNSSWFWVPSNKGTMLLADGNSPPIGKDDSIGLPFISLGHGATLKGLTIMYPIQNPFTPFKYPWTISCNSEGGGSLAGGINIIDVVLINSYRGIRASSDHFISNVSMTALSYGVRVDSAGSIGQMENVDIGHGPWMAYMGLPDTTEINALNRYTIANLVGYDIHYCDGCRISNSFVISANVGMRFNNVIAEAADENFGQNPFVLVNNFQTDGCATALDIRGARGPWDNASGHSWHSLQFSNCEFTGIVSISADTKPPITFTNCSFVMNPFDALYNPYYPNLSFIYQTTGGNSLITLSTCRFAPWAVSQTASADIDYISITDGKVIVNACDFQSQPASGFYHINTGATVNAALKGTVVGSGTYGNLLLGGANAGNIQQAGNFSY